MSFEAMTWAVKQSTESTSQKLVLLMLANYCNGHTGQCNPSHRLLAQECSMGISTLKRCIASLQERGFLTIIHKTSDGVSLPNQYALHMDKTPQKTSQEDVEIAKNQSEDLSKFGGGGSKLDGWGGSKLDGGGGSKSGWGVGPNRATNQEYKPIRKQPRQKLAEASSVPLRSLVDLYTKILPSLRKPRFEVFESSSASKHACDRWRWVMTAKRDDGTRYATNEQEALDWFERYFEYVSGQDFLMGLPDRQGKPRTWKADLAWLVNKENFFKVLGAKYEQPEVYA